MTKLDKMNAINDLDFLIKFPVNQKTILLWLTKVKEVTAKYWPHSNITGCIAAIYFTVNQKGGKKCLVTIKNGMTLREKEESAKMILQSCKSQLNAEIGLM